MEEFNEVYNAYIASYVNLTTLEKREELINQIKELTISIQHLALIQGKKSEFLVNREMTDLNRDIVSEDDFLEGLFAYFCGLKEIIGVYLDNQISEIS